MPPIDRRRFLSMFGVAGAMAAAAPLIPNARVWSFPSKIVVPRSPTFIGADWGLVPGDVVTVQEVWRRVRQPMPEHYVVTRRIGEHLYEVAHPERMPFMILDSYIKPSVTPPVRPAARPSSS